MLVTISASAISPSPNPYYRNSAASFYLNCSDETNDFFYSTQTDIDQGSTDVNGGACQVPTSECQENPAQPQCNELYLYMNDIGGVQQPDTIYVAEALPSSSCPGTVWSSYIDCLQSSNKLVSQTTISFLWPVAQSESLLSGGSKIRNQQPTVEIILTGQDGIIGENKRGYVGLSKKRQSAGGQS